MKSLKYGFFGQIPGFSAAAVALLGLVGFTSPARADVAVLCPSLANQGGSGSNTFTPVAGPLDGTCGANSAVKMDIPTETDYARLRFDSSVANYPAGLTLGNLVGLNAAVQDFTGQPGDQPYYILAFTDLTGGLGQNANTDEILMLEFQTTTLSGSTLAFDPNATQVNLFDNVTGVYLGTGQQDTNTLAGWLLADPFLTGESLQAIRIAIGLSGGGTNPESLTVNSLEITTASSVPEPRGTVVLLITALLGLGLVARRRRGSFVA
jgi:hypothetical protein